MSATAGAYPRLAPELDLRRKLMPEDILEVQVLYEHGVRAGRSKRSVALGLAALFQVSEGTIHYWGDPAYRAQMMAKNARAHGKKRDPADYARHRAMEIARRQERFERNPALAEWHHRVSRKNERAARARKRGEGA